MSTCSLKDFYKVLDVFQRNNFCNVTGMLLEVKDYDIASSFLLSHSLHPTNSSKGASNAINADDKDDGESEKEDEASSKLCRYIIKFSVFQPPHGSKSVYQRALPQDYKVTFCSVSDTYAVYNVV